MQSLTIKAADDWHIHVRDNPYLKNTLAWTTKYCRRALLMPNLLPPLTQVDAVLAYRQRVLEALPQNSHFTPFMTLYLTDDFDAKQIALAKATDFILAAKLYPAGATTHAQHGVKNIKALYPVLEQMQKQDLVLCVHGEVLQNEVDIFSREAVFIDEVLVPLHKSFPKLRIVFEHISTKNAVDFVLSCSDSVAATLTPQHILYDRNKLFEHGLQTLWYCLPVLKTQEDQKALLKAALSGNPKFFMGTDSAPHSKNKKINTCCAAGIFSAPCALETYTQIFDTYEALDKLENFTSVFGANFYKVAHNKDSITLIKESWQVPDELAYGQESIIPMHAGQTLNWKIKTDDALT